jgi:membrane dipeptidase
MLIVDGHEDPAYNTLIDGRDYLRSALDIRVDEEGGPVPDVNGLCMLGLPEWLAGNVAVVVATLTAIPRAEALPGEAGYPNAHAAYQQAIAQLNIYRSWATIHPQISLITQRSDLDHVLASWSDDTTTGERQVGFILLIENADIIQDPSEVGFWHEQGVRMIGPAWHSNRYTFSDRDPGPLTDLGRELLDEMARFNMILDLTHMADEASREALERYPGPVVATHSNPRCIVPTDRMLPDDLIRSIAERNGMIGLMPVNWGIDVEWRKRGKKQDISLDQFIDVIEATCEIAGSVENVGIGSDFDGGFGAESTPVELDTIADLPKLADAMLERGYSTAQTEAIVGGNWLQFFRKYLSE